jgi:hypothetical protein
MRKGGSRFSLCTGSGAPPFTRYIHGGPALLDPHECTQKKPVLLSQDGIYVYYATLRPIS